MENKKQFVSAEERSEVARAVCAWLNKYPDKPTKRIDFEYAADCGMTISTIQTPYKTRQYIDGTYEAQYSFYVSYIGRPATNDARLKMDETLEKMAAWCEATRPDLSGNMICQKVECTSNASLVARFEDGSEEHQVALNLIYEVI